MNKQKALKDKYVKNFCVKKCFIFLRIQIYLKTFEMEFFQKKYLTYLESIRKIFFCTHISFITISEILYKRFEDSFVQHLIGDIRSLRYKLLIPQITQFSVFRFIEIFCYLNSSSLKTSYNWLFLNFKSFLNIWTLIK